MVAYLLNTLLFLNLIASSAYLLLKGLLAWAKGRVDERFRYIGCIAVMLLFLIPFYQVLPGRSAQKDTVLPAGESIAVPRDDHAQRGLLPDDDGTFQTSGFRLEPKTQDRIFAVWCMGTALLLVWYLFTLLRFRRKLSLKHTAPVSRELQQTADRCADAYGIRQTPILRTLPDVQGPMLIGFFRPIIAVPADGLPAEDAGMILTHELVHFKRRDLWWKLLCVLLQSVHWFNPIVWMLCRELEFYAETSCDAEVVKSFTHDERRHYGHLLISYVQPQHDLKPAPGISFTSPREKLKRRISIMLNANKSRKVIAAAIVCVLAASCLAVSAFAAEHHEETPRTIDGIVAEKDAANVFPDKTLPGEVQKDLPFAEKIDPADGWDIKEKNSESGKSFDPAQISLPPLNIPDDFKEAVLRGEVEPFEQGEGVTVFAAR